MIAYLYALAAIRAAFIPSPHLEDLVKPTTLENCKRPGCTENGAGLVSHSVVIDDRVGTRVNVCADCADKAHAVGVRTEAVR